MRLPVKHCSTQSQQSRRGVVGPVVVVMYSIIFTQIAISGVVSIIVVIQGILLFNSINTLKYKTILATTIIRIYKQQSLFLTSSGQIACNKLILSAIVERCSMFIKCVMQVAISVHTIRSFHGQTRAFLMTSTGRSVIKYFQTCKMFSQFPCEPYFRMTGQHVCIHCSVTNVVQQLVPQNSSS